MEQDEKNTPRPGAIYSRLVVDKRISHGAFRLWHYLRNRMNKIDPERYGRAWPEQRRISEEMGCKIHSIKGWVEELKKAGYLQVMTRGHNHFHEYLFLDVALPQPATRKPSGVAQTGMTVLPKPASPRVSHSGNGTYYSEPNPINGGTSPLASGVQTPKLSRSEKISKENELGRVETAITKLEGQKPLDKNQAERFSTLKKKRQQIVDELGWIA